jgi:hypothetical protein
MLKNLQTLLICPVTIIVIYDERPLHVSTVPNERATASLLSVRACKVR